MVRKRARITSLGQSGLAYHPGARRGRASMTATGYDSKGRRVRFTRGIGRLLSFRRVK